MKSGVYRIVNEINNKCYIGSSTDVRYRLARHKHELKYNKHENKYLQNAWNKYGKDSFKFEILFFCDDQVLLQREQEMIKHYQSFWKEDGYNLCPIAGNCLGILRSEETREKMKGNTNAKGRKGCKHSQESKLLMALAKIGKSSGMKGKHFSVETKLKMSIKKVGKPSPKKGKTYKK